LTSFSRHFPDGRGRQPFRPFSSRANLRPSSTRFLCELTFWLCRIPDPNNDELPDSAICFPRCRFWAPFWRPDAERDLQRPYSQYASDSPFFQLRKFNPTIVALRPPPHSPPVTNAGSVTHTYQVDPILPHRSPSPVVSLSRRHGSFNASGGRAQVFFFVQSSGDYPPSICHSLSLRLSQHIPIPSKLQADLSRRLRWLEAHHPFVILSSFFPSSWRCASPIWGTPRRVLLASDSKQSDLLFLRPVPARAVPRSSKPCR